MGRYAAYLNTLHNFDQITSERKKMLAKISKLREDRDVLVFASDFNKNGVAPISIDNTDIVAVQDQLEDLAGNSIDIILETLGGWGETVERIVSLIRDKYDHVGVIIPGQAQSAGTLFAMAGDEILMGDGSSLGPIDGQVMANGKIFSADAFLEGFDKIKQEAESTKKLNLAYVPILQNISPGEIQNHENVQKFSKHLVTKWLAEYKFKDSDTHLTKGEAAEEKKHNRAKEIAARLGSQSEWFTHARSIRIDDLEKLGLHITDYRDKEELNDAITRYYILLRMSFDISPLYKIFETEKSQIYRLIGQVQQMPTNLSNAVVSVVCPHCRYSFKLQINLQDGVGLQEGVLPYPLSTDSMDCPRCGKNINLESTREHVEAQAGKKAVK